MHPLMHPSLAQSLHNQRAAQFEAEATNYRLAATRPSPNKIERFFIKRREGKITWIDTVLVQRSA